MALILQDLRLFLLPVSFFFLFSCSPKKKEAAIPGNIIGQDTMAVIIADMHETEAAITHGLISSADTAATLGQYHALFQEKGITKERFDESYKFYIDNPELLIKIYEMALEELSRRQAEAEKER